MWKKGRNLTLACSDVCTGLPLLSVFSVSRGTCKKDFTWNGYKFEEDTLTFLDLYGTNPDSEIWEILMSSVQIGLSDGKKASFGLILQGGAITLSDTVVLVNGSTLKS
ncbi:hypothetical protein ACFVSS_14970 [Peribacillus butanolivorans]